MSHEKEDIKTLSINEQFSFLQNMAMESLSIEEFKKGCMDIGFLKNYLVLVMSYLRSLPRSFYKIEMIQILIDLIKKSKEIAIRVMMIHKSNNLCLCNDLDFQKHFNFSSNKSKCGLVHLLTKDGNNDLIAQSEDRVSEIIQWFDNIYSIPNVEGQTLYFDPTLLSSNVRELSKEELFSQRITIVDWKCEIDPFFSPYKILCLRVIKKYNTTNGPLEVHVTLDSGKTIEVNKLMYKKGDDLRRDLSAEISFNIFTLIWQKFEMKSSMFSMGQKAVKPFAKTYSIIPLEDGGIFEMIGCTPSKILCLKHPDLTCCIDGRIYEEYSKNGCMECYKHLQIEHLENEKITNLIGSLAGGFIAGYILGVRDRHLENMKFDLCTSTFFHIDFGFILNIKPNFDANLFAIPTVIRNQLESIGVIGKNEIINGWDLFLAVSSNAFLLLRRNSGFLLNLILLLFSYADSFLPETITKSINDAFLMSRSENEAINNVLEQIQSVSFQKIIKDSQHEVLRWMRRNN